MSPPAAPASGNKIAFIAPAAVVIAGALMLLRLHFEPPTVPAYHLAGPQAPGEAVVTHGNPFDLELRPVTPVVGAVAARCFLVQGDSVRAWDPPVTVAPGGVVRIAGPVDVIFAGVPAGTWEVAVAVGRPETLPTSPGDVTQARHAADPDDRPSSWRLVRETIRLEP